MLVKRKLKNNDPSGFDFAESTVIFIKEKLCSYYKMLWNKCKRHWEKNLIHTYFTSNRNIRYRIMENRNGHSYTYYGFKRDFPDNDINEAWIFSYHCCSLIFGFWIAYVWNVLDIFGTVHFIFYSFVFERIPSQCFHISLDSKFSAYFFLTGYWFLLFSCYYLINKVIFCLIIEPYL